jgi:hypothetical protein
MAQLDHDPLPHLLRTSNDSLRYLVRRDLLGERGLRAEGSWLQPQVRKLVRSQGKDGSWRYPGRRPGEATGEDYEYLETYRNLATLVECYALDKHHRSVADAIEYMLSKQTAEGDIRGIYGNQYSPNYTAAVLELIVKAGHDHDRRVERGYEWLMNIRMLDGGWAVPMRTHGIGTIKETLSSDPIPPDRSKPSSHWTTGVVLRAFAVHPKWSRISEVHLAGEILKSRFFKPDRYVDRRASEFWTKFSYPFWFTDLASALDSLSRLSFPGDDPDIMRAVSYFHSRQRPDGSFDLKVLRNGNHDVGDWVGLSICRTLTRLYGACRA